MRFIERNVDIFAEREKELRERTGSVTVPKIFFSERLIGSLVELNALGKDDSEDLERRLTMAVGEGPSVPAYEFNTMVMLLPRYVEFKREKLESVTKFLNSLP